MLLVLSLSPATCEMASLLAQMVKKNPAAMQETQGSIPGSGRSPGKGKVYLLQYSGLKNSHGVAKSQSKSYLGTSE